MNPPDLRTNIATLVVPVALLPATAADMLQLPREQYDAEFLGQELETTYFDSSNFDLRKARQKGGKYLTLRLRCYAGGAGGTGKTYALSAKTEAEKFRLLVTESMAQSVLETESARWNTFNSILPANMIARLNQLVDGDSRSWLTPVSTVCCRRYATEDDQHRLTLDCGIRTETGKTLPYAILEQKSVNPKAQVLPAVGGLYPVKLSKFLWSTST